MQLKDKSFEGKMLHMKIDITSLIKKIFYVEILVIFIIYVYLGNIMLDPDFGWHLRLGEIILKDGIPATDPLSYTMSSFPSISNEWLIDVLMFKLYSAVGFFGLSIIFTVIVLLTLLIVTDLSLWGSKKSKLPVSVPLALTVMVYVGFFKYFGIRTQVVSWFFLSVVYFNLRKTKLTRTRLLIVPLLGIFWINLHGSFPLIIVMLLMYSLSESIKKRKVDIKSSLLTIVTFFVMTVVNPYGLRAWKEPLQQVVDTSVRWTIAEWTPSIFVSNETYWFLVVLSAILLYKNIRKISVFEFFAYLFFLFQSLSSTRHTPFFLIVASPIIIKLLHIYLESVKGIKFGSQRFRKAGVFLFIFSTVLSAYSLYLDATVKKEVSEKEFFPMKAVEFLNEKDLPGRLFSTYDWGGYLDWKLPQKKVFIDGRMATWKWKDAPENESNYIMGEYQDALRGKVSYTDLLDKYDVETVLTRKNTVTSSLKQKLDNLSIKMYEVITGKDVTIVTVAEVLVNSEGWEVVYEDEKTYIFIRRKL